MSYMWFCQIMQVWETIFFIMHAVAIQTQFIQLWWKFDKYFCLYMNMTCSFRLTKIVGLTLPIIKKVFATYDVKENFYFEAISFHCKNIFCVITNLVTIGGLRQLIANLCLSKNQFPLLGMSERGVKGGGLRDTCNL